ncbi:tyrosine-protein kinase SgK223-like [Sinocyclocheilus rhinocerous]|uniref:tyrosine-protein kinase SgK223-like n=1 Tax=Sinocyclocheilus rhinocerous TaxID=307959 RepID=UPI0007BA5F79|nr:PREDICTED: tyrosine-protein kinase SgK223-like [Sinocyclocheilus rhinocerous]
MISYEILIIKLLVPINWQNRYIGRPLLKRLNADDPFLKRDHARLAPEIVSAAQYRKFDEFQTGILIYELLHRRNPFEATPGKCDYRCDELPPIPAASIYSPGLQRLAHLLLEPDPGRRIHIQDARCILQALLWGPRRDRVIIAYREKLSMSEISTLDPENVWLDSLKSAR